MVNRPPFWKQKNWDLTKNHLYHVLLGWLYTGVDNEKAKEHLNLALVYANTETERIGIRKELAESMGVWKYGDRVPTLHTPILLYSHTFHF